MSSIDKAGTFKLGDRTVKRLGYGAMQLAGPGVFGPPKDRDAAVAVLREAVARGVNHIDTSDFYGPHVTNQIIREALHPYPDDLVIVTKVGARRGADASWIPAFSRRRADAGGARQPAQPRASTRSTSSICASCSASTGRPRARSRRRSPSSPSFSGRAWSATSASATSRRRRSPRGARSATIVCVQNHYNLAHRGRRRADRRARARRHRLCAVLPARRLHAAAVVDAVRRRARGSARRRCRSRSPGCCTARPTSC